MLICEIFYAGAVLQHLVNLEWLIRDFLFGFSDPGGVYLLGRVAPIWDYLVSLNDLPGASCPKTAFQK
jgi:hypothetical protein